MEADWYKPKAGEPYRPLIAMPSQLKQKIPWFSFCKNVFTAYDPPHALLTATAFGPGPTPAGNAKAQPLTPVPSATLDPAARKTTIGAGLVPSLTNVAVTERPKAMIDPVLLPKLGVPNPGSSDLKKGSDAKQGGDPKQGSDSKQSSETSGDSSQGSKVKEGSDPKQGSGASGDPRQSNNAKEGSDSKQSSDASGDPRQGNNAKEDSDPKQTSGTSRDSGQSSDSQQSSGTSEGPGQKVSSNVQSLPPSTAAVSSLHATQPVHTVLGKLLHSRSKLGLVQMEIVHGADA